MKKASSILVTGSAGFIGFHLSKRLLEEGFEVVGIDSLNDYYDVSLKKERTKILDAKENFTFYSFDLNDKVELGKIFKEHKFNQVVNLAAQAGVRYSIKNPSAYLNSNLSAFLNILEECRHNDIKHLVFASSSSVYGANTHMPFSVSQAVDHPISLYAATKKSNELMAHSYASNYGLPVTGLRFFTVYGPWGRPDMALFLFTKAILNGEPIDVYNHGKMGRDFTFIDDIIEGIYRLLPYVPMGDKSWDSNNPNPATSFAPYQIFNIGNNSPVELLTFIEAIEKKLGKEAKKNLLPIQNGDVPETFADISRLESAIGYKPNTTIDEGVGRFIDWYRDYYNV